MSENVTTTHLERTVSKPREAVTAVGKVVHITQLSRTVVGISIHVPDVEFKFKAGQWVDFMIPGVETVGGFSMMSSPKKLEKHRLIELAVKKSDHPPAHWVHSKCQIGDNVSLKVGGDFFYDITSKNSKELLFIAGGVGVNPLYSMIQEIYESLRDGQLDNNLKVKLLYSASTLDELIFKDEIVSMTETSENIKCHMFVTQESSAMGNNDYVKVNFGRITEDILEEALTMCDKNDVTVYLCGPPPMIKFVSSSLENAGVDKRNIRCEQWW